MHELLPKRTQEYRERARDIAERVVRPIAAELDEYTRWLAVAVSDAMHHFIGHGNKPADDEARYRAVSGRASSG